MTKFRLLDLPLVVQDHVLSKLTISEQLRFRLVCKGTKSWVDRNSSQIAKNLPTTVIKSNSQLTFTNFCYRKPEPTHLLTSLHLDNESLSVFDDKRMPEFLRLHSHFITSIHLKRYYVCGSNGNQNQRKFLEAFTNLKSFETDEIWITSSGHTNESPQSKIPKTFPALTSLKLGKMFVYNEETGEVFTRFLGVGIPMDQRKIIRWHVYDMMDLCTNLQFLRVPISPKNLYDNTFDECFKLLNYVRLRTRDIPERLFWPCAEPHVMQIDLNDFSCCSSSLEVLLIVGANKRIAFHNVNSKVFKSGSHFVMIGAPTGDPQDYILSFVSTFMINQKFEFLRKLTIKASQIQNECIVGRQKGPDLFPNLNAIDIIFDIGFDPEFSPAVYSANPNDEAGAGVNNRYICFPRADQVLRFFFPADSKYRRCALLRIEFADPIYKYQRKATPTKLTTLPAIISCLPELKTLKLCGWNGNKQSYLKLWEGFPKLEKLFLENCPTLNPTCFIGGNGNPNSIANFQLLPKLNYLELIGLENMPGITTKRGLGINVLSRFGLEPFSFLTRDDSFPKIAVWIRPSASVGPWVPPTDCTIVTRSVSKAQACVKRKPKNTRAKRRKFN